MGNIPNYGERKAVLIKISSWLQSQIATEVKMHNTTAIDIITQRLIHSYDEFPFLIENWRQINEKRNKLSSEEKKAFDEKYGLL